MISKYEISGYGSIRALRGELTRLHAFIGPNDSGKSTILRALGTASQLAASSFEYEEGSDRLLPFEPKLDLLDDEGGLQIVGNSQYRVTTFQEMLMEEFDGSGGMMRRVFDPPHRPTRFHEAALVRFDPECLREMSSLLPTESRRQFLRNRGHGLPAIYQAILGQGDSEFTGIVKRLQVHFPSVRRLSVVAKSATQLGLEVRLSDGTRVEAEHWSEGLLYYLAFEALHSLGTGLFLVEEPETGLHPARIADVMHLLRSFSEQEDCQILVATHSPLVVNELEPQEVSVVTRPSLEAGTIVTPMTETKNFESRAKGYALGELWVSFADGNTESELVGKK